MEFLFQSLFEVNPNYLKVFCPVKVKQLVEIGPGELREGTFGRLKDAVGLFRVMDNYRDALAWGKMPRSSWSKMGITEYFEADRNEIGLSMISEAEVPNTVISALNFPSWTDPIGKIRFFAGRQGCVSDMHVDWFSHWLLHLNLFGTKRFLLIPPESGQKVLAVRNLSALDVRSMSPEDRSAFVHYANGVELTLGPGECMLQPPLWWHHVIYEEDAASLSVGFGIINQYVSTFFRDPRLPRDWRLAILYSTMLKAGELKEEHRCLCEAVRSTWSRRLSSPAEREYVLQTAILGLLGETPLNPSLQSPTWCTVQDPFASARKS